MTGPTSPASPATNLLAANVTSAILQPTGSVTVKISASKGGAIAVGGNKITFPAGVFRSDQNVTMTVSPTVTVSPNPLWSPASNQVGITFQSPVSASDLTPSGSAAASQLAVQLVYPVASFASIALSSQAIVELTESNGDIVTVSPDKVISASTNQVSFSIPSPLLLDALRCHC